VLILLTRPREQSLRTARLLEQRGHQTIIDPVLEIRQLDVPTHDLAGTAAVAVTSAHAAFALANLPHSTPVFAVGDATARAAQAILGRDVDVAAGDGQALARLLMARLPPETGIVLHFCGAEVSPGLADALSAAGYDYRRIITYEAVPAVDMTAAARSALLERRLDAILLYSPRSARLWAQKVEKAGLADQLGSVRAACLSDAVAAELEGLGLAEVRIAVAPTQADLLRCLEAVR
jgi:uroporphyrinogen-III synthase